MTKRKIIILAIILLIIIGLGYIGYVSFFKEKTVVTETEELYTCPMHPQIVSDHPGTCPICGMDLVLKSKGEIEKRQQEVTAVSNVEEVSLSPSQQVLANVQTQKVQVMTFAGEKSFNGYVAINEKNLRHIATPVAGKILKQYVNFEGQYVRAGQPVFEIYSQDLYSTQKEYLLALDNYEQVKKSNNQFAIEQAASLLKAARTKLQLWEIKPQQIEELERTKEAKYSMTEYSKYNGIVTKKFINTGFWASAGETVYDIADLSNVWVIANIYESDMQYIKNGQIAEITSNAYPGEIFTSKINFVNPVYNPNSRTLGVRLDVANTNNKLKPDMYVKVKINTYVTQSIAVPKNAVIRTGERNIVYVEKEKGVYVPREIGINYEQNGYFAVTYGLKEGEVVVSSGGFLIDSETQIQQGLSSGHEEHDTKINPGQDIMKDMENKK